MPIALSTAHASYGLYDLVDKAHKHELQIPEFQRDMVWGPEQVRELLVSLVQDHFAGVLLLLKFNPASPPFHHKEVYGAPPLSPSPTLGVAHSVLDGQQRISALYYALRHPSIPLPPFSRKKPYRFFLGLGELLSGDYDAAVKSEPEGTPSFHNLVNDWCSGLAIPFGPINPRFVRCGPPVTLITIWDLLRSGWTSAAGPLTSFLTTTGSPHSPVTVLSALLPLLNYKFVAVELSPSPPSSSPTSLISAIAPLFVNVNSKGTRLTLFDLAVAHLFPVLHSTGLNLRNLWNDLPRKHPKLALPIRDRWIEPDDFLRAMALITGGSVKKAHLLGHLHTVAHSLVAGRGHTSPAGYTFKHFSDLWDEVASCLEEAFERAIHDYGALKPEWIPYVSMLIPLAALIHVERTSGKGRKEIDCWYWHSVFYERYAKSVDTTAMADFRAITGWILGTSGKPSWISGKVPSGLDLKLENDPKSAVFKGVLNLIALAGANNMLNGFPRGLDLEIDHLFPRNSSKPWSRHPSIESVLNVTLMEPTVNKVKKSKDPDVFYSADVVPGHASSKKSVSNTFKSHLIGPSARKVFSTASSKSPSAIADFEYFIQERERDVLDAIARHLSGC